MEALKIAKNYLQTGPDSIFMSSKGVGNDHL